MAAASYLDQLTAEFRAWRDANGFTAADGDANDISFCPTLSAEQRRWLTDFIARWDEGELANLGEPDAVRAVIQRQRKQEG